MDEVQRRVVAGATAEMLGRGGKTAMAEASGMSRNTVIKAEREVIEGLEPTERLRAAQKLVKTLVISRTRSSSTSPGSTTTTRRP